MFTTVCYQEKDAIENKSSPCEQGRKPVLPSLSEVPPTSGKPWRHEDEGTPPPMSGSYLVELGLTGEGEGGRDSVLLACSGVLASLPGRDRVTNRGDSQGGSPRGHCVYWRREPRGCRAALTGAATWGPFARTRVFRLPLLRALLFPPPGSSNLPGVYTPPTWMHFWVPPGRRS